MFLKTRKLKKWSSGSVSFNLEIGAKWSRWFHLKLVEKINLERNLKLMKAVVKRKWWLKGKVMMKVVIKWSWTSLTLGKTRLVMTIWGTKIKIWEMLMKLVKMITKEIWYFPNHWKWKEKRWRLNRKWKRSKLKSLMQEFAESKKTWQDLELTILRLKGTYWRRLIKTRHIVMLLRRKLMLLRSWCQKRMYLVRWLNSIMEKK